MKNYEVEVAINDFTTIGSNVAILLANLPFPIRYRQRCSRQHVTQCHYQLWNVDDSESLTSILWLKKKIESSVAWSVPSSATIFIITVVKICFGLTRCYQVSPQHFDDSVNSLNWFRQNIKVCGRVVEALWLLFVFSSTRWIKVQEVQPQFPSRNPLPNQRFRE